MRFTRSVSSEDFAPGNASNPSKHRLWTTQTYQPQDQPVSSLTLTRLACLILTVHLSPLQSSTVVLTIDEVNYSVSLTSRSHQGQLYQPDNSSQPELRGVENAVPLPASLGTEQGSAVWSPSQEQANLACRGLWRISLMKYIYDLLQTCIVPRCCVLSDCPSTPTQQYPGRARPSSLDRREPTEEC